MSFQEQIRSLLRRAHRPLVKVGPSVVCPGLGVFASESIEVGEIETVLCLYPGIYSPGLPLHLCDVATEDTSVESHYLGNTMTPAGVSPQDNAYILNLQQEGGGYLDGLALSATSYELDENPSACGHLVNHSPRDANATVVGFRWHDIALGNPTVSTSEDDEFFPLPNANRQDSTPWYLDPATGNVRYHEGGFQCKGAALIAKKDIANGDEIFLDYKLNHPLPRWAEGWYGERR